jgi:predicted DNA-binding transcriptional regulator YafY
MLLPSHNLFWIEWAQLRHVAVVLSDESPVAEFLLAWLRHEAIDFVYWGGATPGLRRQARPIEVYQLSENGPVYARATCLVRQAERVFRLDRVELII